MTGPGMLVSHAYSLKMDATVDLTQTTPDDIVLLLCTIPVTEDERVSINDLTLDPTTGQFSTTAASTITQRDFVATAMQAVWQVRMGQNWE